MGHPNLESSPVSVSTSLNALQRSDYRLNAGAVIAVLDELRFKPGNKDIQLVGELTLRSYHTHHEPDCEYHYLPVLPPSEYYGHATEEERFVAGTEATIGALISVAGYQPHRLSGSAMAGIVSPGMSDPLTEKEKRKRLAGGLMLRAGTLAAISYFSLKGASTIDNGEYLAAPALAYLGANSFRSWIHRKQQLEEAESMKHAIIERDRKALIACLVGKHPDVLTKFS